MVDARPHWEWRTRLTPRLGFLLGFLFCVGLLAVAAWLQFVQGLEPCPLCITQRVFVLLAGLVLCAAAWHNPQRLGRRIYATFAAALALGGATVSARHVWLQHLPEEEVPACGPGLSYVFEHLPLTETLKLLVSGTGECSKIDWVFLGLSIPGWTLIAFLLLAGWSLWNGWR
ncbi:disulfide bond formation protein B [Methylothermus subterraneus]|nr:disulfide bond formation protein B [uncultured Gammaproteobacteria bacterium]